VKSDGFKPVVDACTLCDMCFMTKCPYVPPHEFNLDFPHLMLRFRAVDLARGKVSPLDRQIAKTDRNGKLAGKVAMLANWANDTRNRPTRWLMEKVAEIHRDAALPRFHRRTFEALAKALAPAANRDAPAFGRKAVLFATCYANYNEPRIGEAALGVLARNGVECQVVYPNCCGMPQLEQGDIAGVAALARSGASALLPWIDKGYDVIALVPSCALMLKFEWPLILPDDANIKRVADAAYDLSEYVVDIAKREGMAPGLEPLEGGVALHIACHARAQNMGQKGAEMLRLIPGADIAVIERCSGHGGSWGIKKANFPVALKVGKPVARQIARQTHGASKAFVASECPLAALHIVQGMERLDENPQARQAVHPIELVARSYGL
jgi:glycerol-3-phosphate dehydrogenase subunit C